jgi:hypothetical protein
MDTEDVKLCNLAEESIPNILTLSDERKSTTANEELQSFFAV